MDGDILNKVVSESKNSSTEGSVRPEGTKLVRAATWTGRP